MVDIHEKDSCIILIGDDFDLKIDANRKIYSKQKGESKYTYSNSDIDYGYNVDEKKRFLYQLYVQTQKRRRELQDMKQ